MPGGVWPDSPASRRSARGGPPPGCRRRKPPSTRVCACPGTPRSLRWRGCRRLMRRSPSPPSIRKRTAVAVAPADGVRATATVPPCAHDAAPVADSPSNSYGADVAGRPLRPYDAALVRPGRRACARAHLVDRGAAGRQGVRARGAPIVASGPRPGFVPGKSAASRPHVFAGRLDVAAAAADRRETRLGAVGRVVGRQDGAVENCRRDGGAGGEQTPAEAVRRVAVERDVAQLVSRARCPGEDTPAAVRDAGGHRQLHCR